MRTSVIALALLCCTLARAEERTCEPLQKAYQRAVDAYEQAKKALAAYDDEPLAPLVEGQADQRRDQLQKAVEDARKKVLDTSEAENDCFKKKPCKKLKGGWACIANYTYEKCCLDEQQPSSGKGP